MRRTVPARTVLFGALLLALPWIPPSLGERHVARFRLRQDPTASRQGFILEYDHERFRFEEFDGRRLELRWADLAADDARRLRLRFGLELPPERNPDHVDAHRVRFRSGLVLEGLLMRVDGHDRHWIKREGVVLPYPGDQVEKVVEIKLLETEVFDEDELYVRRLLSRPPETARQHISLANYLYDIGNFEKAREHYRAAVASQPATAAMVGARLARIEDYLADAEAAAVFVKAKARGILHGDHAGATALVEEYVASHPDVKRLGLRIVDEIRERRFERLKAQYNRAKHEAVHRVIERYLVRRRPGCREAMGWVLANLTAQVGGRVRRRLDLTAEEETELRRAPSRAAPHWATYWTGTFIVSKRTRGDADPERWWAQYDDITKQTGFLKAYAAERLPELLTVDRVRFADCGRCGGRGRVKKMSFMGNQSVGGNEWWETCPQCHGQGRERSVAYR